MNDVMYRCAHCGAWHSGSTIPITPEELNCLKHSYWREGRDAAADLVDREGFPLWAGMPLRSASIRALKSPYEEKE